MEIDIGFFGKVAIRQERRNLRDHKTEHIASEQIERALFQTSKQMERALFQIELQFAYQKGKS